MLIGYARVSKSDGSQVLDLQIDALKNAGVKEENIYFDKISGTKEQRDGLDNCLKALREDDVLVVYKLDRLGRSTIEVLQIIEDIKSKGIILHIIKDGLIIDGNISNPINDMLLTLLSGFSQMEKNFISERTKSALAQKKAQGIILGRKKGVIVKSIYDEHLNTIKNLLDKGVSISSISKIVGIGTRQSLNNYIKKIK